MLVFAVGETLALVDPDPNDTLSENVRIMLHTTPLKIPFMILFIGTFGWLIIHWFLEKNPEIQWKIQRGVRKLKGTDKE